MIASAMLILAGAFSRLIPHVPNVTALSAVALLAGAALSRRSWAVVVPLAALLLSDFVLGFHNTMPYVYGALALVSLMSFAGLKKEGSVSIPVLGFATVGSSLLFFLITNFGIWMTAFYYEKSWQGLMNCYAMALPFLGTQVVGDLFYAGLLFGTVELIRRWNLAWFQA